MRTSARNRSRLTGSSASARGRNFSATGVPELEVVGAVDLAHAAAAEQADDAVAAGEHGARRETPDRITREDPRGRRLDRGVRSRPLRFRFRGALQGRRAGGGLVQEVLRGGRPVQQRPDVASQIFVAATGALEECLTLSSGRSSAR